MSLDQQAHVLRSALQAKDGGAIAEAITSRRYDARGEGSTNTGSDGTCMPLVVHDVDFSAVLSALRAASAYYPTIPSIIESMPTGLAEALAEDAGGDLAGALKGCIKSQHDLHSALNDAFGETSGGWLLPAILQSCRMTTHLAISGAATLCHDENDRLKCWCLKASITLLHDSFRHTLLEDSKRTGAMPIALRLMASNFSLHDHGLVEKDEFLSIFYNLISQVTCRKLDKGGTQIEEAGFLFFRGRMNVVSGNYISAEEYFEESKRLVTLEAEKYAPYLVPLKVLLGKSYEELLEKCETNTRQKLTPLCRGVQSGDLHAFNRGLSEHRDWYIENGIYALAYKCRDICYRQRLIMMSNQAEEPHKLFFQGKFVQDFDLRSLEEFECVLARLICNGYVRGVVNHKLKALALLKTEPFPDVSAVYQKICSAQRF